MKNKILILFIVALCLVSFASAVTNSTNVTQTDVLVCINESVQIMEEISSGGYNTLRVNDSLKQIVSLYDSQVVLMDKKKNYDWSIVIPYCDEVKNIKENFVVAVDELSALLQFYNASLVPGMDTTTIDVMIKGVKNEITNERYENVKGMTDKVYSEIINVQSSNTALNIFISSTTGSLKRFFLNNWKLLLTIMAILVVGFLIYRIKILKWITQGKINNLNLRKSSLKALIMKTQKDYFQLGKIAESEYNIKTKKFAELVRDIDRQIPLLQEELIKLERKDTTQVREIRKSRGLNKHAESFRPVIRAIHKPVQKHVSAKVKHVKTKKSKKK